MPMELASATEALILADGTKVMPDGRIIHPQITLNVTQEPSAKEVRAIVAARKRLSDLPDVPARMNAMSAIIAYTLYGLTDTDIADALHISVAQISTIRMQDAYAIMYKAIVDGMLKQDADDVRTMIAKHARAAVAKTVTIMETTESDVTALAAAKDLLDRSGHRPTDVVEHHMRIEGGLTIEYVKKDTTNEMPIIDITAEM